MSEYVKELSSDEFDDFIKEGLAFVDFWASWCGPCKAIAPIVDQLAEENDGVVKFGKVNVDEDGSQAIAQRYGIMSIPTLILFKDGKIADKAVGMRPKAGLQQMIDENK